MNTLAAKFATPVDLRGRSRIGTPVRAVGPRRLRLVNGKPHGLRSANRDTACARLAALALPERLADAILQARHITRWEARRRQMQFIGRLMRDVDPLPIQARLEQWAGASNAEKARLAHVERWRTRLLSEADALDHLCAENAWADRPRLAALVARISDERAHGEPPHAYRELFRTLNALFAGT